LHGPDINDPAQWVNDPSLEDPGPEDDANQVSPAVSFVKDDIVVCWVGPGLADCEGTSVRHIYARRFKFDDLLNPGTLELRDPNPAWGEGRPGMFVVDNNTEVALDLDTAKPAVALAGYAYGEEEAPHKGYFVVAWNAIIPNNPVDYEVHAQYFDSYGEPLGREFRVNVADGTDDYARLARSGQHTIAFGPDGTMVATWTQGEDPEGVFFTLVPAGWWETTTPDWPCYQPGDVNGDCSVNGSDIQFFIDVLFAAHPQCYTAVQLAPADMDVDGNVDLDDVPLFVLALLTAPAGRDGGLQDCNANGVPDDCDVDPADPDGNEEVSPDCNANGIPDECDFRLPPPLGSLDCNENGVPDECDIADCEGDPACGDCNGNGFPDGCDIAAEVSLDENANGIPDECEGGGEGLMGGEGQQGCEQGSGETEGTNDGGVPSRMQAWAEFHEWCDAQDWGPDADASGAEQFQAMTAKLRELGLPVQRP
jgi:hypothetical protein